MDAMPNPLDPIEDTTALPAEAPSHIYAALTRAREAKQLSVADVAAHLKLTPRQINALEQADFANLPSKTFVRGFVRNYAKFLELEPEPFLAALDATQPSEPAEKVPNHAERTRQTAPKSDEVEISRGHRSWLKYALGLSGLAIAIMVGASIIEYRLQDKKTEPAAVPLTLPPPPSPTPPPATSNTAPAENAGTVQPTTPSPTNPPIANAPAAPVTTPANTPVPVPAPAPPPAVVPTPPPPSPEVVKPAPQAADNKPTETNKSGAIQLSSKQDAWVQITDSQGKKIFSGTLTAGKNEVLDGKPPFKLIVGNAKSVTLNYHGKAVALDEHIKGEVARLKLD